MSKPLAIRNVLINKCYGGFEFSKTFLETYRERAKERSVEPVLKEGHYYFPVKVRADPLILEVFEELGSKKSSGGFAKLDTKEVLESELDYVEIEENDGYEHLRVNVGNMYRDMLFEFLEKHKDDTMVDITDLRKKVSDREAEIKAYMGYEGIRKN
jgi:hypothetical protein